MEITNDDYDRWRNDPVTREVFKILKERQRLISIKLAEGGALVSPDNAIAIGRYSEINDLLMMAYEDMKEGE